MNEATKLPRWRPTRISTIFRDKNKLWTADKITKLNKLTPVLRVAILRQIQIEERGNKTI